MGVGACASGGDLVSVAGDGQRLATESGCAACHGGDFSGGVAPSWVGLYGSTVTLSDGSTIVADRAYLVESIRDPSAKLVADYSVEMPSNQLSDAEVDRIVDFIVGLAGD
jgi:cytochrome c oxidase subunit 2